MEKEKTCFCCGGSFDKIISRTLSTDVGEPLV